MKIFCRFIPPKKSFDDGKELGSSCQVNIVKMLASGAHFEHEINQWSLSRLV